MIIVFATNNSHKLHEVRNIAGESLTIKSLLEAGIETIMPEDFPTLELNALQKAKYIHDNYGFDCFADDTGLEVEALDGEPGVFSARYSLTGFPTFPGMEITKGNIKKLLLKMEKAENRAAKFRTIIALIFNKKEYFFEGVVNGFITHYPTGTYGFGYDSVFQPLGSNITYGQMSLSQKNVISHRAIAFQKLKDFFKQ